MYIYIYIHIFIPFGEEVDGAVVAERGEVAQSRVEDFRAGRHAEAHVDVGAHALDEVRVERNLWTETRLGVRVNANPLTNTHTQIYLNIY